MVLTKRQLAFAKKVLEDKHYAMAAKYWERGDDVALNTYHRNIQELLVKRGFRANRDDYKSYHWNCEHGAHNSIGLWYDYLPHNGYMDDPRGRHLGARYPEHAAVGSGDRGDGCGRFNVPSSEESAKPFSTATRKKKMKKNNKKNKTTRTGGEAKDLGHNNKEADASRSSRGKTVAAKDNDDGSNIINVWSKRKMAASGKRPGGVAWSHVAKGSSSGLLAVGA
mmetsp:Transcript_8429/g.16537  ORF Transcript_8429/g.16537 Transcript_8429/m.16537 type:complete len:223 (-) Transcript_8429:282-950(-)